MSPDVPSITLHPNRLSAIALLLVSLAFTAAGIGMALSNDWRGFLVAGFFALGIPVFGIQLIPGSTYLHVDQAGFTICALFRTSTIPWSDVDAFLVVHTRHSSGVKINSLVGFNFVASYDCSVRTRRIARIVLDCEGTLPDTYGLKAEKLAEFMNACLTAVRATEVDEPS